MTHPSTLAECYKAFFSNYTNFDGRARRSEFWWPTLVNAIISCIPWLNGLWGLVVLIPTISVGVRRLHDLGKSGWWYLLVLIPGIGAIILLIMFAKTGESGSNQYGEDPMI